MNMLESDLLTRNRCDEIFSVAANAARARGVYELEAHIGVRESALTRFANNTIHQNVAERSGVLSVRAVLDGKTARATTNRLDADSIRDVVDQAIDITRLAEGDGSAMPLPTPQEYQTVDRYFDSTAEATPADRADAVAEVVNSMESQSLNSAGIFSTGRSVSALLNSHELFAYHAQTRARFSITAMAPDSSGWAKRSVEALMDVNFRELASRAASKALLSASPRELPPGRYTVILEPAAVLDLVGQMFGDFSATALTDKRSFLEERIGQKLFGDNIHIEDDVYHPLQSGPAFDGEGLPRRRLTLVDKGTVREVAYSRPAARIAGVEPTGHGFPLPNEIGEAPVNIVIAGGDSSVEEMIASTERGILVTRFWYIREVDPYEKIMTGMTRDGTFLVENGQIAAGVRNLRFNESLIEMLKNVEMLGPAEASSGEESFDMVVPAMKVRDFHFTETTRF
jgi:PmbA protein